MAEETELQKDLTTLAAEMKRLEAEYNMFFAGRLPRPPWETRGRVEAMVKRHGRGHIVYTSLSWFRELPAGVPGAYRLFANLISLGK